MIKVIVQRYVDRNATPPLQFETVDEFQFDPRELLSYRQDEAMYQVLKKKVWERGYEYPMQFWSMGDDEKVVKLVLNDRTWG